MAALLMVAGLLAVCPPSKAADQSELIAQGERIYLEGRLPSGEPLRAVTQGDINIRGTQFSCANCHRRSGFGSSEGGNYVPPVTGPILYEARRLDRAAMFKKLFKESQPNRFWSRVRSPRMREAYTDESLARSIRDGIDAGGRTLDPLMPRYELSEEDMAALIAYMKTLSAVPDPGVDDKSIHFATIIAGNPGPAPTQAMLDTMSKFVKWMNLDTQGDTRNPNFSPYYRTDFINAYRTWTLDVWELSGAPDTWRDQLEALYAKRPVFAVISGLVEGPWSPIHHFCEVQRLPCLFPHTSLPATDETNVYSVHFNRGLTLEAETVARFLLRDPELHDGARIVQLYEAGFLGTVPASALERMLRESGTRMQIEAKEFTDAAALSGALERLAGATRVPDALVIWSGHQARAVFEELANTRVGARRIILPSAALDFVPGEMPAALTERLAFSYPYELPTAYHPRAFRVRAWMRTRGLDITYPRLQFNTYYALTMVQYGLEHIVNDFSRDYLLEYVEHEAENALNPGTFPRLSLGPGQRFASKGAYVVKLEMNSQQHIVPISEWIVP